MKVNVLSNLKIDMLPRGHCTDFKQLNLIILFLFSGFKQKRKEYTKSIHNYCMFDHRKLKACVYHFLPNFYFSPNDRPLKFMRNVFISSKKLLSFSRYSNFHISIFFSFSPCLSLL